MSPTQEQVFKQVNDLLAANFDATVVSVAYSDESGMQWTRNWYTGGRIQAIGLMRVVEQSLLDDHLHPATEGSN